MSLPIVAVVGRPNVGKSTLVNRLAQSSEAIVHETRGVTRDRSYHRTDWCGHAFILIDTGGIESAKEDPFAESITIQAKVAMDEADVIILVVDGVTGITPGDEEIARMLTRSKAPVFLAVNKMDTPDRDGAMHEFWSLGLGEPHPVSALHGHGTGDLLDEVTARMPQRTEHVDLPGINVAIIGKPNAGKSSLLNRLTGSERAIVSEVAGTTRDALDIVVSRAGSVYRFVDTAGIRRRARIDEDVEYYGFVRAMRAIDRADVALLVIDAAEGVTDQDQRVARFASERGCGLAVVFNKWDLIVDPAVREDVNDQLSRRLGFVSYAPVVRVSALTGSRTDRLFTAVDTIWSNYQREIPTSSLNKVLSEIREFGHTVNKGGRTLRIHYVTQTRTRPPGFTFFANHPSLADDSFRRYIENRMRTAFDFTGTPITLAFKSKGR